MGYDPVGFITTGNVGNLGAHLHARRRNSELPQLETEFFGQHVQNPERFFAGRIVIIEIGDFQSFYRLPLSVLDVFDCGGGL